ncbi:receptor-like protein 46 [Aristolochia californica]|uniref:receptor-like protein 46 n=1 Tax=Aristolochia californica TaxID=171875 RepID=UPI0035D66853
MGNTPVERPVLGIVSLCLIFSWVVLCVSGQCHDAERDTLSKFRNGLNDRDNRLSSWGNNSDCCRWRGIACDNKTGYVTKLDLSRYGFESTIPNWIANLSHLVSLNLSGNQFYGEIPMSIGNITSLVELDLSENRIDGSIPESISNLHQLEHLDLSYNIIDGGPTLDKLCQLKKLKVFSLPECNLKGTIPACLGELSSLEVINLWSNRLDGALPGSLGQLAQLSELRIGNNYLSGTVSEVHFKYLSNLSLLDLSSNFLTLRFEDDWSPPFQLSVIRLGTCHLVPQFPPWLKTQKHLFELDISKTNISGNIPEWLWDNRLSILNLSRNTIEAKLPNPLKVGHGAMLDLSYNLFWGPVPSMLEYVSFVDISNNKFSGPLPHHISQAFPGLQFFSASNNQISGTIPMSIGELGLLLLDLSKNNFRGSIPPTIGNCRSLIVLDLSENFLQGDIPETIGSIIWLKYLHMRKNNLSGQIPYSICNCFLLETIDLGENRLFGNIPARIGNLSGLRNLRLRSNLLSGKIPPQLAEAQYIDVLDLAHNNLTGLIPPSLGKLFAMRNRDEFSKVWILFPQNIPQKGIGQHYMDNLFVLRQGRIQEYTSTLFLVTNLDLSNNNLEGKIPEELTNNSNLLLLNLAHNHFTGNIPKNIGNMSLLESLDLSNNQLSGSIPQSLSFLTTLNYLNLSYNNLSGRIPSGPQLQVLNYPSIYWGNPELCGLPLIDICPGDNPTRGGEDNGDEGKENENDGNQESDMLWVYAGIAPGFAVGFSGVLLILIFKESWRLSFFKFADTLSTKLSLHRLSLFFNPTAGKTALEKHSRNKSKKLSVESPCWVVLCVGGQCHDGERDALTKFRNSLNDPLNRLSSWGNHSDCCGWRGIACDKKTGSVTKLDLRNPYPNSLSTGEVSSHGYWNLSGRLDLSLLELKHLRSNQLDGALPDSLGQLAQLSGLQIGNNSLSGDIPEWFWDIRLKTLNLSRNMIEGKLSNRFKGRQGTMYDLSFIDISNNKFSGPLPQLIGQAFPGLNLLYASNNQISGTIPMSIGEMGFLGFLDLSKNNLRGSIPPMIGICINLMVLDLSENFLQGDIPKTLGSLDSLYYLHMGKNNLSGHIPYSIYNCLSLETVDLEYTSTLFLVTSLDLSNNNLEGKIPEELTNNSNLLLLNLAHNCFTGNIPKNIGNMSLLESLDLSNNQLSGSIPQSLSFLTALSYLKLSYNNLFGRIPFGPQLQVLDYPSIYWGNFELCGTPLTDICPGDNLTRGGEAICDEGQENENNGNEESDMLWVYAEISPGFAVGFSGVLLILMLKESWRLSFFHFADTLSTKLSLHAR